MRTNTSKALTVLGIVALASGAAAAFVYFVPDVNEAERAPDFTIQTVRGGPWTLSEHRGELVVIDLMAVDCASCRITEKAMLELDRLRPNVTIISVDVWSAPPANEDEAYLDAHMVKLNATWAYGMDTDDVLFKYNGFEISKVVVIDRDGYQTWSAVGGIDVAPILAALDAAEAGTATPERNLQLGLTGFAVFAGVASFFAPCAFPLLPGYMAYSLSLGRTDKNSKDPGGRVRDALAPGLSAAGGIFVVYGLLGLLVAAFGGAASRALPYMQPAVGLVAIGLGVALVAGFSMERVVAPMQRGIDKLRRRITGAESEGTLAGYFSYGVGYGAAAAGCVAPVFLQLVLTAVAVGAVTGFKVFLVYAGVSAALMVLATIIAVKARTWLQKRTGVLVRVVNRASGAIMILAGIYLIWFFSRGTANPFAL